MKRFVEIEEFFTLGKSSAEYHPVWDYEPHTSPSLLSMEAYETAFPQAEELSHQLNISPIALYFIEDKDLEGHLARYINGTSFSPVIVLTDRVHDIDEAHLTLFHELGHAYLDSVGAGSGDEREEDVAETFAHIAYMDGFNEAVDFLKAEVGEEGESYG